MNKKILALAVMIAMAGVARAGNDDNGKNGNNDNHSHTLVLSRSVYAGGPSTVTVGEILPPNCPGATLVPLVLTSTVNVPLIAGGTTPVKVTCGQATKDGTYPTIFDNDAADGSFGLTSPIFLDYMTPNGKLLHTLSVPTDMIVTSFSSKSELALNRSLDGKSITFVGYVGGPGFITGPNVLDVSDANTPGIVDPTNPAPAQYYRAVAEVDAWGHISVTDNNAYSGNNGRAAIKVNSIYYMTGNGNNGGLKGSQFTTTQIGLDLLGSNGVELAYPGQTPPAPPMPINKIGNFDITQVNIPGTNSKYVADKPGKDNNFRGLTIFNNTLYVSKGSGGNGINTVYQVGDSGVLPTGPESSLSTVPITILPGFPTYLATGADQATGKIATPISFPFGLFFADAHTVYVADEGDGCTSNSAPASPCLDILTASSTVTQAQVVASIYNHAQNQKGAGLQKWIFDPVAGQWNLAYVIQAGLNLGVQYTVPDNPNFTPSSYPTGTNPATGLPWAPATEGLRNITGRVNGDGTATIWAITSTLSGDGDQGADPNRLVMVTDRLSDTSLSKSNSLDVFKTVRSALTGEVLRGVTLAPKDRDDQGGNE